MIFYTEYVYSGTQIRADISFLKYQIDRNCHTALVPGTGISKLIGDCETFLADPIKNAINLPAVHALYALCNSVKTLWLHDRQFCLQFNSINTGDYQYGKISQEGEIFYKDMEFELFSAAALVGNGLDATLPDHTTGNDIYCSDIEIQCKHPNVLKKEAIDKHLRDFHLRLIENNTYGIFGMAVEDCFDFAKLNEPNEVDNFTKHLDKMRRDVEAVLYEVFQTCLQDKARVLGIFQTGSYFAPSKASPFGLHLVRDANAAFCFRPDRKEIKDASYKNAFRILVSFNPSPSWLTFENRKLTSINDEAV